ncbi:MAG: MFS transporter [Candidatus Latescibacteria bacterium]|nr:MFS transporter [Candidatus Latescibacterota bacterium]
MYRLQQPTIAPFPQARRKLLPPAFQFPAFRAYWGGMLASVSGSQMFIFIQVVLAHELVKSPLFLGYVGLANAIPSILLNLYGGVFADRLDKRRLMIVTQAISGLLLFLLATLVLLQLLQPWHLLTIAFLTGAVNAFDQATRQAIVPDLVDQKSLMSASALTGIIWQGTRIASPAIAGLILVWIGTATSIYVAGAGFLVMMVVMVRLRVPKAPVAHHGSAAREIADGLKFIKTSPIFSFLIGMTFFNSFFAISFAWLMPIFAMDILHVGAGGQGLLLAMTGIGGLLVSVLLSTAGRFPRPRLLIVGGAVVTGLSLAAFATTAELIGSFPLAMALMFILGLSSTAYMTAIRTLLLVLVPRHMLGRVMGFYSMMWSITPLGGMQAAFLANFIGAPAAVAIGGLAVAIFAIGPALLSKRLRNLESELLQAHAASEAHAPR